MKSGGASRSFAASARGVERAPAARAGQRSLREPSRRLLTWALSISALAHLALTPFAGLIGLMAWLFTPADEPDGEAEQLTSIPITLLSEEESAQLEAASAPPPSAPSAPVVLPPDPPSPAPAAPAPPAPPTPPAPKPPEPAKPTPKPTKSGPEGAGHPVAMSGVNSEVVDSNANVNLLLLTERIRNHPLGPRIGKLIVAFPQWSSFFESGEIDPVRDINRLLVVGPQFRRSADVVAILEHDLPAPVLRAAVDRLVQRPPRGRWLKSKIPAAYAHADRAERLFAMTAPHVLVVAPPHLEKQILTAPPTQFPTPAGDEAVVLHVKTPWRALMGLPFRLPESIAWLRLDVLPNADGSVQVRITAEDADARLAAEHARSLSDALNALTNPDLGALGALVGLRSIAFIDRIEFQARQQRISGQVRVSQRQLERLLVYAEELVASWTGRRSTPGEPSAPAVAPTSPAAPRSLPSPPRPVPSPTPADPARPVQPAP
ncbi:MAG TPA: hypothetical protein VMG12_32875 [Polyangiaceae bacterium]|nr:hypothetical protein [Polyangiaceae bacterium]